MRQKADAIGPTSDSRMKIAPKPSAVPPASNARKENRGILCTAYR
jgi:hypothetical protein